MLCKGFSKQSRKIAQTKGPFGRFLARLVKDNENSSLWAYSLSQMASVPMRTSSESVHSSFIRL